MECSWRETPPITVGTPPRDYSSWPFSAASEAASRATFCSMTFLPPSRIPATFLWATTAGGMLIDVCSGVTPEVVMPSEHIVTTAVLAGGVYAGIALLGKQSTRFFPVTLIAALVSFLFRVFAVRDHWPQIVPMNAPPERPVVAPPARRAHL